MENRHNQCRMASQNPKRYSRMLEKLRLARHEAGFSQQEAATALHVPQQWISKAETGVRRIDPTELQDFADLYKKPLEFFLAK